MTHSSADYMYQSPEIKLGLASCKTIKFLKESNPLTLKGFLKLMNRFKRPLKCVSSGPLTLAPSIWAQTGQMDLRQFLPSHTEPSSGWWWNHLGITLDLGILSPTLFFEIGTLISYHWSFPLVSFLLSLTWIFFYYTFESIDCSYQTLFLIIFFI